MNHIGLAREIPFMVQSHLDRLVRRAPHLSACVCEIEKAFHMLREAFRAKHKLLLCGTGGSAADAEHWAAELLKGFCHKRPLSSQEKAKLPPDLAERFQGAFPVIPLTGFPALSSAFANNVAAAYSLVHRRTRYCFIARVLEIALQKDAMIV